MKQDTFEDDGVRIYGRRELLARGSALTGTSLIASLFGGRLSVLRAQGSPSRRYDLLIKGGRVIDPSQQLSAERDVGISGTKIVRVAANIPEAEALQVLDARGKIVTPGLIDIHVHVYDGVAPLGIPADPNCIAKGVTTVVDAGSAGAHTFPGLRQLVLNVANTRVLVLLNISVVGQSTSSFDNQWGELLDLRYVNPKLAVKTIEQNRDVIVGIKVRLSQGITGPNDLKALALAREAADAVQLPMMAHIGDSYTPLTQLLPMLRKGDVMTHCFVGKGGILDSRDRILPEVRKAVSEGVHLDVGHGRGSFSFDVAEKAIGQELLPGTISSDVHQYNVNGPVFDLATTLSKFLLLGLTLEQVFERVTANPSRLFRALNGFGSLREGAEADVAIFSLQEGGFNFVDSLGDNRKGNLRLMPAATVKAGRIYGSASVPVVRL